MKLYRNFIQMSIVISLKKIIFAHNLNWTQLLNKSTLWPFLFYIRALGKVKQPREGSPRAAPLHGGCCTGIGQGPGRGPGGLPRRGPPQRRPRPPGRAGGSQRRGTSASGPGGKWAMESIILNYLEVISLQIWCEATWDKLKQLMDNLGWSLKGSAYRLCLGFSVPSKMPPAHRTY